jgi:alpha-amylase
MSERGQIEIIGGGFYEPIFSVISENDIKGQIGLMQDFCRKEFGVSPKGFWTAERVWDPDIPRLVSDFNFDYTVLDDIHFRYAGVEADRLYGHYLTERLDKKIRVFPIDRFLRYSIPFKLPEETIRYFMEKTDASGGSAFIYGDDGEKFGLWPETYKWVYEEKWLRNFIEAVLKEGWIKMTHPSEYIAAHQPLGRIYLTQGSYFELSEWALPAQSALKLMNLNKEIKEKGREDEFYAFLKGGVWNNFLNKYHESNALNKRALLLSREISEYEKESKSDMGGIKRELYRGECNCAYWHGLFGGIYLGNLRGALYEHLLKAEHLLLVRKGQKEISILEDDFWNEGRSQVLIRKRDQSVIIVPYAGGMVSEFSFLDKAFNIMNTMQRRIEAYHEILKNFDENSENNRETRSIHDRVTVKEKGLKKYLVSDETRRYSFKDLFFNGIPPAEDIMFRNAKIHDWGRYTYDYNMHMEGGQAVVSLSREGEIEGAPVRVSKKYIIETASSGIKAAYRISCGRAMQFGCELNINLLGGHDEDRFFHIRGVGRQESFLDSAGIAGMHSEFSLIDKYADLKIGIGASREFTLIRYPVYTVSQSDSGFEKNFQGSSLILAFDLKEGVNEFIIEISFVQLSGDCL